MAACDKAFSHRTNTPIFFVDLWLPYSTDIAYTEKIAAEVETHINAQPGVDNTMVTVGQGALRFMLTYNAQRQYANYAQILVRTDALNQIPSLIGDIEAYIRANYPEVKGQAKRIMFGPSNNSSIEARFIGNDPTILRSLAAEGRAWRPKAEQVASADPDSDGIMHDWQESSKVIRPQFSDYLGRELGVDKREIDNTLRMSFGGINVGLYRDGTRLMPIVLRTPGCGTVECRQAQ
ncbi:MAG: hypothetical protein ACMZI0_11540 [Symbiopectobacterium sp.]|uniref:hypothetical protein n=1 Tax=Symbiopectobacterium sp. TaxID=2952789 RepID=UPI0039EADE5D